MSHRENARTLEMVPLGFYLYNQPISTPLSWCINPVIIGKMVVPLKWYPYNLQPHIHLIVGIYWVY